MREELSGSSAAGLVLGFVVCVGMGWMIGSLLGAFVGAIVSAAAGILVTSGRTFGRGLREPESNVNTSELPPQAALAVMSAGVGDARAFVSELLAQLDDIRTMASDDPEGALAAAMRLRAEHPHTPAVSAEVARCQLTVGRQDEAMVAASDAIRLALDGGMNPTAAQLWEQFGEERERLKLSRGHWERLARVLDHRGELQAAAWCRARAQQEG